MELPQMKRGSGTILGVYKLGTYSAMLIRDAESAGPIKYFYMLSVTEQGSKAPTIVVTLEHNEMQGELLRSAAQKLDEETRKSLLENAPKSFLCMFDKNGGHHVLEQIEQVLSEEQFREKAFSVAARELGVADAPRRLGVADAPKGIDRYSPPATTSATDTPKWPIIVTAIALALVVLMPPYTEHFSTARSGGISGHGGWKFLFEIGKFNTRIQTESISVGLWLLEILVVIAVGGVLCWITRKRS